MKIKLKESDRIPLVSRPRVIVSILKNFNISFLPNISRRHYSVHFYLEIKLKENVLLFLKRETFVIKFKAVSCQKGVESLQPKGGNLGYFKP